MRLIKMLGLAALTAMAAMAFVGVSTAAADAENIVLCEAAELECANPFPNPTTIVGHAVKTKLLTSVFTLLCEKSLAEVELLNVLGASGEGHLTSLTFEECHTASETACTITVLETGTLTFEKSGALLGTVKSDGKTKANMKCGFFINCTFGGSPELTIHSTATGVTALVATEARLEEGEGFACPSESFWDAEYTALGAMWVES